MKASFRGLSRQLITVLCCCLLATALTGMILGLSDRSIQLPAAVTQGLIAIHQGAFLGEKLTPLYVLLIGLGVFILGLKTAIEGRHSILFERSQPLVANTFRTIALILVIPLVFCVETGVAYRLGMDWFSMSSKQTTALLSLHGGSSLEVVLGIFYLLITSSSLILLSILSWKTDIFTLRQKQIQQTLRQQFRKVYSAQDSLPNHLLKSTSNKIKLGIGFSSIILLGILYYFTSAMVLAITTVSVILLALIIILFRKMLAGWQYQKKALSRLRQQETLSATMLKAIPDSILRISQTGICLSYMPATEAKHFILCGDIINKHLTEFLAPAIAEGLIKAAQISLQTGSTQYFRFPISVDDESKYHEARITIIGETEVLILVREIADYDLTLTEQILINENLTSVKLLSEADLVQVLQLTLQDMSQRPRNQVLICLAIDSLKTSEDGTSSVDNDLLNQIAARIAASLLESSIFHLQDNNLVVLVSDRTMEQASLLVDNLHCDLNEVFSNRQDPPGSIEFNLGLLEVNSNSSDAIALVNASKATCQMAKQKVNFKTFW
jgi:GGDEF domain-containing protein